MDSLTQKINSATVPSPEEQATMDASIRENRRSVGARTLVDAVRAARARGLSQTQMDEELADHKKAYPKLYSMVCDPGHSEAMLNAMLAQLEAVEAGRKSTHDASVHVGTALVNSFVRPQLGMAPVPLPGSAPQSGRR
jgi:hypothetical protein